MSPFDLFKHLSDKSVVVWL